MPAALTVSAPLPPMMVSVPADAVTVAATLPSVIRFSPATSVIAPPRLPSVTFRTCPPASRKPRCEVWSATVVTWVAASVWIVTTLPAGGIQVAGPEPSAPLMRSELPSAVTVIVPNPAVIAVVPCWLRLIAPLPPKIVVPVAAGSASITSGLGLPAALTVSAPLPPTMVSVPSEAVTVAATWPSVIQFSPATSVIEPPALPSTEFAARGTACPVVVSVTVVWLAASVWITSTSPAPGFQVFDSPSAPITVRALPSELTVMIPAPAATVASPYCSSSTAPVPPITVVPPNEPFTVAAPAPPTRQTPPSKIESPVSMSTSPAPPKTVLAPSPGVKASASLASTTIGLEL